jgi:hypothetical protein
MPKRVPLETITLQRTKDGKPTGDASNPLMSVSPKIGDPFEFTAAEIEHIEKVRPEALSSEIKVDLKADDAKPAPKPAAPATGKGGDL